MSRTDESTSAVSGLGAARRPRLDSLTAMRFAAAIAVVFSHLNKLYPHGGERADYLQYGVDFFFILSGFVLAWSYAPQRSAGRFYWLRFARVWPMHLLTFLVVAVAWTSHFDALTALRNLTLTQSWSQSPQVYWSFNGVSWTLSIEAFFYLCFPLAIVALRGLELRRLKIACCGWIVLYAAICVAGYLIWPHEGSGVSERFWFLQTLPATRLPQFLIGVTLALMIARGWRPRLRPTLAAVAVVLVVIVGAVIHVEQPVMSVLLTPLFAALIAAGASRDLSREAGHGVPRSLVKLGEWSFALYLTHPIVLHLLLPHAPTDDAGYLAAVVIAAIAVAVSAATFELLEAPIERRLRALGRPVARPTPVQL